MARLVLSIYYLDNGREKRLAALDFFRVTDGFRLETTREQDRRILPSSMSALLIDGRTTRGRTGCNYIAQPRFYRLWDQVNSWVALPCPFRGGSAEMLELETELRNSSRYRAIDYIGEGYILDLGLFQ